MHPGELAADLRVRPRPAPRAALLRRSEQRHERLHVPLLAIQLGQALRGDLLGRVLVDGHHEHARRSVRVAERRGPDVGRLAQPVRGVAGVVRLGADLLEQECVRLGIGLARLVRVCECLFIVRIRDEALYERIHFAGIHLARTLPLVRFCEQFGSRGPRVRPSARAMRCAESFEQAVMPARRRCCCRRRRRSLLVRFATRVAPDAGGRAGARPARGGEKGAGRGNARRRSGERRRGDRGGCRRGGARWRHCGAGADGDRRNLRRGARRSGASLESRSSGRAPASMHRRAVLPRTTSTTTPSASTAPIAATRKRRFRGRTWITICWRLAVDDGVDDSDPSDIGAGDAGAGHSQRWERRGAEEQAECARGAPGLDAEGGTAAAGPDPARRDRRVVHPRARALGSAPPRSPGAAAAPSRRRAHEHVFLRAQFRDPRLGASSSWGRFGAVLMWRAITTIASSSDGRGAP